MFADRLKELRKEAHLTQRQLAAKARLSPGAIALYELGRRSPNLDMAIKLSRLFDVSTDYLLGRTDIKEPAEIRGKIVMDLDGLTVGSVLKLEQYKDYLLLEQGHLDESTTAQTGS